MTDATSRQAVGVVLEIKRYGCDGDRWMSADEWKEGIRKSGMKVGYR